MVFKLADICLKALLCEGLREMQCLPVIILLISSVYSSDEVFSEEPSDNDEITTKISYAMVGNINNKGRRYDDDDTTNIIEELNKQEEINLSTEGTEILPPISFPRNVRSFEFYDDLYDSYRHKNMKENKNNDPKNILNDVRARNSQSNAYNEDQQRRMFFSHIFSLFDDDRNTKRLGKSNNKSKRYKSRNDQEIDGFKNPKARTEQPTLQNKYHSYRKNSLKTKDIEPEYESFESAIESYLNSKRLSDNQHNEENEGRHKKKSKGKHQSKRNNSRPERQLGDSEIFESIENHNQDDGENLELVSDSMTKYRKRKNTYNDEIYDVQTSTPVSEIDDEKDSSETAYLVRTPSFNYYQTDVTQPDDEESVSNKETESVINIDSSANTKDEEDTDVFKAKYGNFNSTESEHHIEESVTFNPNVFSTLIDNQNTKSASQEESINIIEREPITVEEIKKNQTLSDLSEKKSKTGNKLLNKDTRRVNHTSVNKVTNKPSDISTIKEEIETPEEELHVSKVFDNAAVPSNVRNPLSARIKLDLLIQLPSQIDIGNEI